MRVYKFLDANFGMKSLSEKRLKISTIDDLNDPFELLPFDMADKTLRMALNMARKEWGAKHGVMCFSAGWRDPVIWAHYSDKHRGLCLGFEIPDACGTRVHYKRNRLPRSEKLELRHATAWIYTKYENWKYEEEIRCCTTLEEKVDGLYFMNFGESLKLVQVIAGARCELTETAIQDAVKPLNDVEVIKARPGFQRFEIVKQQRGFPE